MPALPSGTGNTTDDPLFENAGLDDYHLSASSTLINAGLNDSWMTGTFDLDGNERIFDGTVDMGADEYYVDTDTDGDGVFTVYESIAMSTGTDGGLLIGQAQLASIPATSTLDGTEIAPFDSPWLFLGNYGAHQSTSPVTIFSDDGNGNVQLDFSGWGVTWNGIPNIDLGGSVDFSDTGLAVVTCTLDCSDGDIFTLDYTAHVPLLDPSGFAGVYWGMHLEGVVSAVPVPAAVWLFGSGLLGLIGFARRKA